MSEYINLMIEFIFFNIMLIFCAIITVFWMGLIGVIFEAIRTAIREEGTE